MTQLHTLRRLTAISFAMCLGCTVTPSDPGAQRPVDPVESRSMLARQNAGPSTPESPGDIRRMSAAAPAGVFRSAVAYPTGVRESSVLLLEADGPQEVRIGQPYAYTLRVTNLSSSPLHHVSVFDASAPPTPEKRETAASSPTTTQGSRPLATPWDVGTLAPRESKSRQINGTADEVGILRNCLAAAYTPTLCTALRVVKPELQMTREAPADVMICQTISVTYVVSNVGTGTADAVRLHEDLPDGLMTADGARELSLNLGDIRAGESRSQTVALKAGRTGEFTTRATAVSGDAQAQSREMTTAVREPVLALSVTAPESRYADEAVDYRITVKNTGDIAAQSARLQLTVASPVPGEAQPDRDLGTIAPGDTKTLAISLRAPRTAGDLRLTASAEARCAKTATANAAVSILTIPALLLECNDSIDPVRIGSTTIYTITVTNQGWGADTNVTVKALVPPEELYVDSQGASAIHAAGQTLTFDPITTLAPKQSVQWKVEVKGLRPGDARFNVDLTSDSLTRPASKSESTRVVGDAQDIKAAGVKTGEVGKK